MKRAATLLETAKISYYDCGNKMSLSYSLTQCHLPLKALTPFPLTWRIAQNVTLISYNSKSVLRHRIVLRTSSDSSNVASSLSYFSWANTPSS
jgi:hypothetical protein